MEIRITAPESHLYGKYPTQTNAQPVYVYLRDGELTAETDWSIGGSCPMDVFEGEAHRFTIPSELTTGAIEQIMSAIAEKLTEIWEDEDVDLAAEIDCLTNNWNWGSEDYLVICDAAGFCVDDRSMMADLIRRPATDETITSILIDVAKESDVDILENIESFIAARRSEIEDEDEEIDINDLDPHDAATCQHPVCAAKRN